MPEVSNELLWLIAICTGSGYAIAAIIREACQGAATIIRARRGDTELPHGGPSMRGLFIGFTRPGAGPGHGADDAG
ncbi:hypothetical protein [Sphingopyxis sp. YR583]|uniref:hypothetical protein n=1 Tax=Sphingopyxis sp. YR583 TaxID=1881047 RepID=UPI00115F9E1F|nr:hypothetical protein [Sphingopyxis sp. YR583]